jgi:hypothetical protein
MAMGGVLMFTQSECKEITATSLHHGHTMVNMKNVVVGCDIGYKNCIKIKKMPEA